VSFDEPGVINKQSRAHTDTNTRRVICTGYECGQRSTRCTAIHCSMRRNRLRFSACCCALEQQHCTNDDLGNSVVRLRIANTGLLCPMCVRRRSCCRLPLRPEHQRAWPRRLRYNCLSFALSSLPPAPPAPSAPLTLTLAAAAAMCALAPAPVGRHRGSGNLPKRLRRRLGRCGYGGGGGASAAGSRSWRGNAKSARHVTEAVHDKGRLRRRRWAVAHVVARAGPRLARRRQPGAVPVKQRTE
jgi:hypothetical protein